LYDLILLIQIRIQLCVFQGKKIELKNNIGWQVFIAQGAKVWSLHHPLAWIKNFVLAGDKM
jgi:hypothetical protein